MRVEDAMKRVGGVAAEVGMVSPTEKSIGEQNIAREPKNMEISQVVAGEESGTTEKAEIEKTGTDKVGTEKIKIEKNETEKNEIEKNEAEKMNATGNGRIAETGTVEETQTEKKLESEAAESEAAKPESAPTFVIKKTTIKKALLCAAGLTVAIILLVCCLGNAEIRDVKNGVLEDYNYGVSIGDALHKWFGGTEKWSSFSENGVVYVMARGITKYTVTKKSQEQIFLFHHINDGYFVFDGAFDSDGDYLYMGNGNVDLFDLGDMIVFGLYEQTLKAAFGDKETLKKFMGQE